MLSLNPNFPCRKSNTNNDPFESYGNKYSEDAKRNKPQPNTFSPPTKSQSNTFDAFGSPDKQDSGFGQPQPASNNFANFGDFSNFGQEKPKQQAQPQAQPQPTKVTTDGIKL